MLNFCLSDESYGLLLGSSPELGTGEAEWIEEGNDGVELFGEGFEIACGFLMTCPYTLLLHNILEVLLGTFR